MFRFFFTAKKGDIFFSIVAVAIFCGLLSLQGNVTTKNLSPEEETYNKTVEILRDKKSSVKEEEIHQLSKTICVESKKHGIDPLLLLAIIETESSFSNNAVSNKNARGLMQVVPDTAREIARREKIKWEGYKTLHTPTINIRIGTYYFKKLLKRFDGNVELALSAYNNGPTRVARLLRKGTTPSLKYTRKVLKNYKKLQKVYGV